MGHALGQRRRDARSVGDVLYAADAVAAAFDHLMQCPLRFVNMQAGLATALDADEVIAEVSTQMTNK